MDLSQLLRLRWSVFPAAWKVGYLKGDGKDEKEVLEIV